MENKEKSINEGTKRNRFCTLLKKRVAKQLDLLVTDTYFTYKVAVEPDKIYLIPNIEGEGLLLVLSTATFRDAVYGTTLKNMEETIQSYDMVAAMQLFEGESEKISFGKTMNITRETTPESLIKFWCTNWVHAQKRPRQSFGGVLNLCYITAMY